MPKLKLGFSSMTHPNGDVLKADGEFLISAFRLQNSQRYWLDLTGTVTPQSGKPSCSSLTRRGTGPYSPRYYCRAISRKSQKELHVTNLQEQIIKPRALLLPRPILPS